LINDTFFVHETIIDLDVPYLLEGGASGTSYWIEVVGYPVDNIVAGWESTTVSTVGVETAFKTTGDWQNNSNADGVYSFNGECESLGLESQNLEEIELYPNPVKDILQLDIPNAINIENVLIQNSMGQILWSKTKNFQSLDMSNYASGLYIVTVNTGAGSVSKRIIKN